jgi:RimJ/RimL family protein N-acetyltransferase
MKRIPNSAASPRSVFMHSARLSFRNWAETDEAIAFELWGDPLVIRYIDAREKLSIDEVRQRLAREIAGVRDFGVQYWPIFLRSTDAHVGCCGLRPYDLSRNIYELGFHIRSSLWGQGFATEAALRVMAYAFTELDVSALFAGHNPHNTVSRHLLQKLGFRFTHDEYYEPTGLYHPSYMLTAEAYRNIKKNA